jgi:tRNA/tmRNA/rRNA uracil-C5-methylase (TrmA/RlmC/RlmD family)
MRIEEIHVHGNSFQYRVSKESFWQGHIRAAEVLGEAALNSLSPRKGERALDLYGGVGLFAKLLASAGARVEIIESSSAAISDAQFNLRDFSDVRFHEGDVAKEIVKIKEAEIVLLDPPRSGAELVVLEQIVKLAPRRICYISCDPASLARDTQRLAERGYQLVQSAAFDLFPQTAHIECVFTFEPVIS